MTTLHERARLVPSSEKLTDSQMARALRLVGLSDASVCTDSLVCAGRPLCALLASAHITLTAHISTLSAQP
jgi:hypothetical protein